MVLESLLSTRNVKEHPLPIFFLGFFYAVLAFLISYYVFRDAAGILMVFLVVVATLPLVYQVIRQEEEVELHLDSERSILREHSKVIIFLMFLFFGATIGFLVTYLVFPTEMVQTTFSLQHQAITSVNAQVQGQVIGGGVFSSILLNNVKVLFFCIIFSFLYGTGAIFILTWNASVIATAMGAFMRNQQAEITSFFTLTAVGFFRYMTHGVFEVASYFMAGLAGGILSVALIRHNLREKKIITDALDLLLISFAFLVFAAVVEVFITPALFF